MRTKNHNPTIRRTSVYKSPGFIARLVMQAIFKRSITKGTLHIRFETEDVVVGKGNYSCTIEPPSLSRFVRLLLRPDINVADHFVRGYWNCEQYRLYDFLELLFRNRDSFLWRYFKYLNDRSPLRDSVIYRIFPSYINRKTAIHYSSNIEFMKTVLGETLLYTCAFFETDEDSLQSAQLKKVMTVARRLEIDDTDDVLELGCGWGNAAQIISDRYSCHVTGVNLTEKQVVYAQEHGSSKTEFVHSIVSSFLPSKQFSKIYSIGMLEHIGVRQYDSFFSKISELLESDGTALVHCIVREEPGATNSWIDKVIFPGGYIPCVSEIAKSIEATNLSIKAIHIHEKTNYFKTLDAWRTNLYQNEAQLRDLLASDLSEDEVEKIMRMWDFYLTISQLSFSPEFGKYQNVQIILGKR